MNPIIRRLFPSPAESVDIATEYKAHRPRPSGRPWIALSMISSLDGSVAIEGTSGGLGNENDLKVLLTLRSLADTIIVGAGTARAEAYGPPRRQGQRIGLVTNSGNIDPSSELFESGAGFVIAPTSATIDPAIDVIRAGGAQVDLPAAVAQIPDLIANAAFVTVEGGPTLNGAMLTAGLVDELNLTLSPHLVGGSGPRLTTNAADVKEQLDLAHLLVDDENFVFSRWVRPPAC